MTPTPAPDLETAKFFVDLAGVVATVAVGALATLIAWLSWRTSKRAAMTAEQAEATSRRVAAEQADRTDRLERVDFARSCRDLVGYLLQDWETGVRAKAGVLRARDLVALQETALTFTGPNETAVLLANRIAALGLLANTTGNFRPEDKEIMRQAGGKMRLGITAWVRNPADWAAEVVDVDYVTSRLKDAQTNQQ